MLIVEFIKQYFFSTHFSCVYTCYFWAVLSWLFLQQSAPSSPSNSSSSSDSSSDSDFEPGQKQGQGTHCFIVHTILYNGISQFQALPVFALNIDDVNWFAFFQAPCDLWWRRFSQKSQTMMTAAQRRRLPSRPTHPTVILGQSPKGLFTLNSGLPKVDSHESNN